MLTITKSNGQATVLKITGDNIENLSFWEFNCYDYLSGIYRNNKDMQTLRSSKIHFSNIKPERFYIGEVCFLIEPNDTASLHISGAQGNIKCNVEYSKYPGNYLWPFEIKRITASYVKVYTEHKNDISLLIEKVSKIYKDSEVELQELESKNRMSATAYQVYFSELKYMYYNYITSFYLDKDNSSSFELKKIISEFNKESFNNEVLTQTSPFFIQALTTFFTSISITEKTPVI